MRFLFSLIAFLLAATSASAQFAIEVSSSSVSTREHISIGVVPPNTIKTTEARKAFCESIIWEVRRNLEPKIAIVPEGNVGSCGPMRLRLGREGEYSLTATADGMLADAYFEVHSTYSLNQSLDDLTKSIVETRQGEGEQTFEDIIATDASQNAKPRHLVGTEDELTGGATDITKYLQRIITAIVSLAGVVAVFVLVWQSVGPGGLIMSLGDPDAWTKTKATLTWTALGLLLIMFAYMIVKTFLNFAFSGENVPEQQEQTEQCPADTIEHFREIDVLFLDTEAIIDGDAAKTIRALESYNTQAQTLFANAARAQEMGLADIAKLEKRILDIQLKVNDARRAPQAVEDALAQFTTRKASIAVDCEDFPKPDSVTGKSAEALKADMEQLPETAQAAADGLDLSLKDVDALFNGIFSGKMIYTVDSEGQQRFATTDDYDGDGISNDNEVRLGSDPFDRGL